MRIIIDEDTQQLHAESSDAVRIYDLYSKEAFELLSSYWVKLGWNQKYTYTFTWMERPIIQLPEDMLRIQEVICDLRPDVIIETGVAHGGSLIFYASLCKALEHGRVIGIDIDIRPHNRKAIEEHLLSSYITLFEGDSVNPMLLDSVKNSIAANKSILVILDSCHSHQHVLAELEAYQDLVTVGSYLVVTDGIMQHLYDVPRGNTCWQKDNPVTAVEEFLQTHCEFIYEQPIWLFNESELSKNITHWPMAWLKKIR